MYVEDWLSDFSANSFMQSSHHKILLVEDHKLLLEGLKSLLASEDDLQVIGEAHSVADAITELERECPDLAVVDLSLVGSRGMELVRYLAEHYPHVKILVFSQRPAWVMADRVLAAGAHGYKQKSPGDLEVVEVIRKLLNGETYITPCDTPEDAVSYEYLAKIQELSDREFEVFELLGAGTKTAAIAQQLGTSNSTVRTMLNRIKNKLGADEAAEVRKIALAWQLDAIL